jgi:hypothetical protein
MDDFQEIIQNITDNGKPQPAAAVPAVNGPALRYSPDLLVDIIIRNPDLDHKQLGLMFGRGASWIAACIASRAFQDALEPRRHEVADPSISMSMDERFQALTIRALTVLNEKLDAGKALPDSTVLQAVAVGVKALGMGQKTPETAKPADEPMNSSERVAQRIMEAMDKRRAAVVDVEAKEVKE